MATKKRKTRAELETPNGVYSSEPVGPRIHEGGFSSQEEGEYTKILGELTQDHAIFNLVNDMLEEAYRNGKYDNDDRF